MSRGSSIEKHEYLMKRDYYENKPVGTKAKSDKYCAHCGSVIKKGTPHDVHHFYPEFSSYPTHKECTEDFMDSLNDEIIEDED